MDRTVAQISTHLVRQHRRVRRGLPDLASLAADATAGAEHQRQRAARHTVRFLEQEVLAQAEVEDALIDGALGQAPRLELGRLRPDHDSLRIAAGRLGEFTESPTPTFDVAGFLQGLRGLLTAHLDDEWRSLIPLLAHLDDDRADRLATLLGPPPTDRGEAVERLHLPTSFETAGERLSAWLRSSAVAPIVRSAEATVHRAARDLQVELRHPLDLRLDLVPVVAGRHVVLLVGRLHSAEMETVLAPVELEVALAREGTATTLEVRHSLVPARHLPNEAPAHRLTRAAVHALAGELALVGSGREPRPRPDTTTPTIPRKATR